MTEAKQLSKGRLFLALAALFLSSMCTLGDLVINPIVANLYEIFADDPEWLINFAVTGPALVGLPFGLLAGVLCDRMDKKWIMVIGFAIFTVSAVFGAVDDIYLFTTLRCLATGVGWGITNTAALAILADMFPNEDEHGKFVGWYNSAMSIMGALMAAVAGMLAVAAWQNAFFAYWISIPVLVMLIVFLPKMPPSHVANAESGAKKAAAPAGWWTKLVPLTIQVFFVAICYFVMLYMIAVYVVDAGVGDEAFIGMLASAGTIATAVASIIFGAVYKRMKNFVYVPALFIMAACFIVMGFFPSPVTTILGVVVAGFFWPFYFCYFYVRATELVPASKGGTATSIVAFSDGLAAAGSSYLLTGLVGATGMTAVGVWPIMGYALIAVAVVSVIYLLVFRNAPVANVQDASGSASEKTIEVEAEEAHDKGLGNK